MNIWGALGFVGLGMLIAHIHNCVAWRKYYEGRKDGREERNGRNAR